MAFPRLRRSHREVDLARDRKVVDNSGSSNNAPKHRPGSKTEAARGPSPSPCRRPSHNGHCLVPWPLLRVLRTRHRTSRLQAVSLHNVRLAPAKYHQYWMPPEYRTIPRCSNMSHKTTDTQSISPRPQPSGQHPPRHDPRPCHP